MGHYASLCKDEVLGQGNVNPLTTEQSLTSALFGYELWSDLSRTEVLMLKRMQRFCAKIMQRFGRHTRSYIPCRMLALNSIESYIDQLKLKFCWRVSELSSSCISTQIFLQRLFQAIYYLKNHQGFSQEVLGLCRKYNLK